MLISIFDSVYHEVSGTEAVAAEGRSGDLNMEDLDTPFLLCDLIENLTVLQPGLSFSVPGCSLS